MVFKSKRTTLINLNMVDAQVTFDANLRYPHAILEIPKNS